MFLGSGERERSSDTTGDYYFVFSCKVKAETKMDQFPVWWKFDEQPLKAVPSYGFSSGMFIQGNLPVF
jgi:hypothetical protein